MSSEPRVVFAAGFDSLFSKEVRARVTPALEAELLALGVNLKKPFNPAYPVEAWAGSVKACAKHLFPDAKGNEGFFELGRLTMRGFRETLIGAAIFGVMRLIGPARTLERSARTYASASNYTQVSLKRLSESSYEMGLNEAHTPPEYDMGVIDQAIELLGVKPSVKLLNASSEGFLMLVSWEK
ncbi:MAG: DUF2378 family protein [Archangium sp.]|nr:DUF2378 family protein [Archangium sp.]